MTNGGTGPYYSNLLFINSGRGPGHPPTVALVNPSPPHNSTVLLDNYYGRQFNSLNDIKVHPSGNIFFTDVMYVVIWQINTLERDVKLEIDTAIYITSALTHYCLAKYIGLTLEQAMFALSQRILTSQMGSRFLQAERRHTCRSPFSPVPSVN